MSNTEVGLLVSAVVALVVALTGFVQVATTQHQLLAHTEDIKRLSTKAALHDEQLNGGLDAKVTAKVAEIVLPAVTGGKIQGVSLK